MNSVFSRYAKVSSWLNLFVSAFISDRLIVAVFYHSLIPECLGGGCPVSERFLSILEPFGFFVVFFVSLYMSFLNWIFVKNNGSTFSRILGVGAGIGSVFFYPFNGNEIIDPLLDMVSERDSMFGLALTVMAYPLLFGFIFLLLALGYFIFHNYRQQT